MYHAKVKKPKIYDFDLIVIGSGAGGGVAAHLAAQEGKKVGLVEAHLLGGQSPHSGCVPTKALLKAAEILEIVQTAGQYGIRTGSISYNYRSIQAWRDKAVKNTGVHGEGQMYKTDGISLIRGHAHFINPWIINVGQQHYSAKYFLIATGSVPTVPQIPGLSDAGFITYLQAANVNKLPKSIFIIGGGAVGYEYAQFFSLLGSHVHLAEYADHLLPNEDPEVGDSAEAALNAKGVRVHTKATVIHVNGSGGRKVITFEQDSQQHRVAVEEIMVATGKLPNLDLGLENIAVRCNKRGIEVNRYMQTSQKHIFAAGDVAGQYSSYHSHVAIQEGRVAMHNVFHRHKIAVSYHAVPKCLFGVPEIATVGKSERDLVVSGEPYQTSIAPIGILGRAMTNNYTGGFVKIIATHTGILLGASIVAPLASEMIQELTFAIQHHQHACAISNTLHPFLTWSEAVRIAADRIRCI